MNKIITLPAPSECVVEQLRIQVASARTTVHQNYVYDKSTGECYGIYVRNPFTPEEEEDQPETSHSTKAFWDIKEDGTPLPPERTERRANQVAPVTELFPERMTQPTKKAIAGRKPQALNNPFATALWMLKVEGKPLSWFDDFAFGGIYIGPGVVGGKHSVALADVKKLLMLQEISVTNAAQVLLNHDREPMSTRQLQRVIEAARVTLRGIALHLERNPHILQSVDVMIDFEQFWAGTAPEPKLVKEHPKKQQALAMLEAGGHFRTIANALGVARNTVKKWGEVQAGNSPCGVGQ
ncbi:hypothetical protein [Pseudomonas sp. Marseille-P9899]|uniref:hypothetical protein n=1 Tax=Pseudomonas sp. Marseille-P9899 TaxID=2730401 RepID=UPI00158AA0E9|nr:hypothetical protein [Pseudomonas sp. Marseille-P9899]